MKPSTKCFGDSYVMGKSIGAGHFSVVRKCRCKRTKSSYAVKVVKISEDENKGEQVRMLENEVNIMKALSHNNIVLLIDVFFTPEKALLVLELAEHGDLHDYVVDNSFISTEERQCLKLARQIASSVEYLHTLKFVHRDIKPENFLLFKQEGLVTLKLCDFGLAERVPQDSGLTLVCGSPSFIAPEVISQRPYGRKVDVWACGAVFYFLFCRHFPFGGERLADTFSEIREKPLELRDDDWMYVSNEAKQVLMKTLTKDPAKRWTSSQLLRCDWFTKEVQRKPSTAGHREPKRSFKSAATAVRAAAIFVKTARRVSRETALMPKDILNVLASRSEKTEEKENKSEKITENSTESLKIDNE